MNEITAQPPQAEPKLPTAPRPPMTAGAKPMGLVPQSIEEVGRIANVAVDAGLMGKVSKYDTKEMKLPKAMMIIMAGLELGITPMQAFNGIAIINGRTAPWGKLARSLVLRRGHKIEETFEGKDGEPDFKAVCKITRGDNGSFKESSFSIEDATTAGLWQTAAIVKKKEWGDNNTSKMVDAPNDSPWYRYKKDMLAARAFSRACNIVADALMGMELAEVMRDVEDHSSNREEDRGPVTVAAPPPPLATSLHEISDSAGWSNKADRVEVRKPPVDDPEPVKPETPRAPPTPAEEKVPEHAGPTERALIDLARNLDAAKTLDEVEQVLEDFNRDWDGNISDNFDRRVEAIYEARVAKL